MNYRPINGRPRSSASLVKPRAHAEEPAPQSDQCSAVTSGDKVMSCPTTSSTHLFRAVQQGNLQRFMDLVARHYPDGSWSTMHQDRSGDTVLHLLARHGHLDLLTFFVEEASVVNLEAGNFDAKRPLHEAAQAGHGPCVQFLLQHGAVVDSLKRADWTPLMLACTKKNLEVVKLLTSHGARPQLCNKDGWNAFHIACREGSVAVMNHLLDLDATLWDTVSKNGRTPLHTAALHGQLEVVRVLLTRGQYMVDARDSCGVTSLMDALRADHVDVAKCLVQEHHACVRLEDNMGRQAIHLAAQAGSEAAVTYLVDDQAVEVDSRLSLTGATPLHVAAKEGQASMVQLLSRLGSKVNMTDSRGRTALHIAVGCHQTECVRSLLQIGARADVTDQAGHTPRHNATRAEVQVVLEEFTAKSNEKSASSS